MRSELNYEGLKIPIEEELITIPTNSKIATAIHDAATNMEKEKQREEPEAPIKEVGDK